MKNFKVAEELKESILHMVINYGEESNYYERIQMKFVKLMDVMDLTKEECLTLIKMCIGIEVLNNKEVYKFGSENLMEVVEEYQSIFNSIITCATMQKL